LDTRTTTPITTSTALLDALFEDALVGRCLVAPDGTILRANTEWLRSTGFTRDVVGVDIVALFPQMRDMAIAMHARARAGHRVEVPRHAQTVNGRETWWQGSIDPIPMEGGTGLLITTREVSDEIASSAPGTTHALKVAAERLAQDLDAMMRLHRLSTRFVRAGDLPQAVLEEIVDVAISITHADMGNIQLLDPTTRRLKVVAHRGHERWWLDYFESVAEGKGASCGAALQQGARAIVEDVTRSPVFVGTPALEVQLRAGIRAVQSTPLFGGSGDLVGMISTHFRSPHRPDDRDLRLLDLLARQAADMIERVRSGEARRESEERFRAFVLASSDVVYRMSADWSEMRELRGREFIADSPAPTRGWLDKYIHPDDQPLVAATIAAAIRTRSTFELEHRVRRVDGSMGWTFSRAIPIVGATGEIVEWFGAASDVTRRKQAEQALRESEERFRLLVRGMKDYAIYMLAPDGTVSSWNAGAERIFGYREDEIVGRHRGFFFTPEQRAEGRPERDLERALRDGRYHDEGWRIRRDGSRLFADVLITALYDDSGRLRGFANVTRDVTERRRSEAALRESEERLRLAQQVARAGSFDWDVQSGVNTWTPELEALYGLPPGGFARTEAAWEQLVHPDDRAEAVRRVEQAFESGMPAEAEWRVVWPDGSVHWIAGRWQVLKDGLCKPVRMTGINFDITDRKRAEELGASEAALREADRQKNQFLGMLSHELRNPLGPIRNALYLLDRTPPQGQEARRAREVIHRQVGHLTRLVDDLLDVTRITRGKVELRRAELDLAGLVRRTADDYRWTMQDRGLELALELEDGLLAVDGDETRLAQVFGNLLSNAAKFTPVGGRVTIAVRSEDGHAVVRVRDTGPGIPPDVLPSIFEPFTQAKQTLARTEGGLGLGLALVRGLVSLHGGEVRVVSGLGGAEFVVTLPLAARQEPRAPHPAGPARVAAPVAHRRVLVVDDSRDAAETLAELVRLLGHDVEVAYDGPAALRRAGEYHPDLVLCDIGLPGMDGYEVARELRAAHGRDLRLVALSGYAQPEDVAMAMAAGFDAHVPKPADPQRLEQLLANPAADRPPPVS
jgi:PAS domain S-box-containing protein